MRRRAVAVPERPAAGFEACAGAGHGTRSGARRAALAGALPGLLFVACGLVGCASTTVTVTPSPQPPVCHGAAGTLVLWAPRWRPDQKDVTERELAAATGLEDFLRSSGCFTAPQWRREADASQIAAAAEAALASGRFAKVVTVVVSELGPLLKIGSSLALVEGGTEVVLEVGEYAVAMASRRRFAVHWQNGGPGVVKGTGTLAADMRAALTAGLQAGSWAR